MKHILLSMRWIALALITANFAFCQVTIPWTQVNKTGSSLADLTTRSAADLSSGTLPLARLPAFTGGDATTTAGSGAITLGNVNAAVGTFGTSTQAVTITVDAKGRITNISQVAASPSTIFIQDSSDSTSYVLIADDATGDKQAKTDGGLTYNASTGVLTATKFAGPINGSIGGDTKNYGYFSILRSQSGNVDAVVIGADSGASTITDATSKSGMVSIPHYLTAEENVMLWRMFNSNGNNALTIGGGSSSNNAVTSIKFYTAGNSTTTIGTDRGGFDSAGKFEVTATTASTNATSGAVVIGGGLGLGGAINATGAISSGAVVTGTIHHSTSGTHTSSATGTGNDGGAGSVTYGGIAPITFYVKDVPVLTSGAPADIATISLPAGITRWTTTLGSSTNSGGVRCSAWDFTATMAGANFTLYAGAGGTGTALTGVFTGPGSDTVYTSAAAASGSTIVQSNTIYIRQTANSTNSDSCDFYITIYPLP